MKILEKKSYKTIQEFFDDIISPVCIFFRIIIINDDFIYRGEKTNFTQIITENRLIVKFNSIIYCCINNYH